MSTVIKAEGLSKKYILSHEQPERYTALRDVIARKAKGIARGVVSPFLRGGSPNGNDGKREDLWALRDVSFEIQQGETVGIIGRNGAGKSTLLKILSRITEPTEGRVTLKGRVASLLEVGTGFHPELTGRENIYLNGAILGMTKAEMKRKFDEIVDFAEIDKFLDTPVKRYSSGMYVRLAFAVAAHLEPEILLVDEVLAVGDAGFQRKCITRIDSVAAKGRTVLLVSHNMGIIASLCSRAILFDCGRLIFDGDAAEATERYSDIGPESDGEVCLVDHPGRVHGMGVALLSARLLSDNDQLRSIFKIEDKWKLVVDYANTSNGSFIGIGFGIYTAVGVRVGGFNSCMAQKPPYNLPRKGSVAFSVPRLNLCPGHYSITLSVGGNQQGFLYDKVEHALRFSVERSDIYGTGWILTPEDGVHVMHAECKITSGE